MENTSSWHKIIDPVLNIVFVIPGLPFGKLTDRYVSTHIEFREFEDNVPPVVQLLEEAMRTLRSFRREEKNDGLGPFMYTRPDDE